MPDIPPGLLWELADMPHSPLPLAGNLLPPIPGLYIVYQHAQVLYIGQTMSLARRWQLHHRREEFARYPAAALAWLSRPEGTSTTLHIEEKYLIAALQPCLNGRKFTAAPSINMQIGQRMRRIRQAQDLTIYELAALLQISPATVTRYEQGKIVFYLKMFLRIAKALAVKPPTLDSDWPAIAGLLNMPLSELDPSLNNFPAKRQAAGLSMVEFAQLMDVNTVTVWRWEKGELNVSLDTIRHMARVLNTTPLELDPSLSNLPDKDPIHA